MTTTRHTPPTNHPPRERTLGLPVSAERALMGKAYENYATAQRLHTAAHNHWRRLRHLKGQTKTEGWSKLKADRSPQVKTALAKATEAAMLLADAKGQYRQARDAARAVAA